MTGYIKNLVSFVASLLLASSGKLHTRIHEMHTLRKIMVTLSVSLILMASAPGNAIANESGTETGDELAVALDLLVLRPIGLIGTVGGLVLFVGSIPFSLATLSVDKAFNALVVGPVRYTFVRPLGNENIVP
jgi:hypothetical protein